MWVTTERSYRLTQAPFKLAKNGIHSLYTVKNYLGNTFRVNILNLKIFIESPKVKCFAVTTMVCWRSY